MLRPCGFILMLFNITSLSYRFLQNSAAMGSTFDLVIPGIFLIQLKKKIFPKYCMTTYK